MTIRHVQNRRDFLKTAAWGAAALAAPWPAAASAAVRRGLAVPPARTVRIAAIGSGGKGAVDIGAVASQEIVGLCDAHFDNAAGTFKRFPDAPRYRDYRRMLLDLDDRIDAVTVSTPDHTHFPAAMMAISMGKHIFVQKPLTHSVWEARELTLAARRHGVATQMGIQGHAEENKRRIVEFIHAGLIGTVREVHIWTDRPIWPQGLDRPKETPPAPAGLDWNLWLGVAPDRPYHPSYLPFKWRGWWDFGTGALGDIGCHALDAPFWALDLGQPDWMEAETSPVNAETAPLWSIVTYHFPARGARPELKLVWYDGGKAPPRPAELPADDGWPGGGGTMYVGTDGILLHGGPLDGFRILPESRQRDVKDKLPPKTLPRSIGHYEEWIAACHGGAAPGACFDYSGPLTEIVLLGNLAVRLGGRIEWSAKKFACTNRPEANALLRRSYRLY